MTTDYTVRVYDEGTSDEFTVFEGSLEACREFIDGDEEYYIVAPDGFTVVE